MAMKTNAQSAPIDRSLIDPDRPQTIDPQSQSSTDRFLKFPLRSLGSLLSKNPTNTFSLHHNSRSERLVWGNIFVAGFGSPQNTLKLRADQNQIQLIGSILKSYQKPPLLPSFPSMQIRIRTEVAD